MDTKGYGVFNEPPWREEDKDCEFYWPEIVKGMTEKEISPEMIMHLGGGEFKAASGVEGSLEATAEMLQMETDSAEFFGPRMLWETAEEQDEVFQKLVKTEGDITAFSSHCKAKRNTDPVEVWLILTTIQNRMRRLIYGDGSAMVAEE